MRRPVLRIITKDNDPYTPTPPVLLEYELWTWQQVFCLRGANGWFFVWVVLMDADQHYVLSKFQCGTWHTTCLCLPVLPLLEIPIPPPVLAHPTGETSSHPVAPAQTLHWWHHCYYSQDKEMHPHTPAGQNLLLCTSLNSNINKHWPKKLNPLFMMCTSTKHRKLLKDP